MLLREKALRGDTRALGKLIELARSYNNDAAEQPVSIQPLPPEDQAILAAYVAEAVAFPTPGENDEPPPPSIAQEKPPTTDE